jgi:hypothetical protein
MNYKIVPPAAGSFHSFAMALRHSLSRGRENTEFPDGNKPDNKYFNEFGDEP